MENKKLEKFTTEKLRSRKRIASVLIVVIITAVVLDISMLIYDLIIGKGFNISLFVTATACFVISIPIYLGKKKIEEELKKRDNN